MFNFVKRVSFRIRKYFIKLFHMSYTPQQLRDIKTCLNTDIFSNLILKVHNINVIDSQPRITVEVVFTGGETLNMFFEKVQYNNLQSGLSLPDPTNIVQLDILNPLLNTIHQQTKKNTTKLMGLL